jgi:hypothetical protein
LGRCGELWKIGVLTHFVSCDSSEIVLAASDALTCNRIGAVVAPLL